MNENIVYGEVQDKVLIGLTENGTNSKIAVTKEQFEDLDKSLYTVDGVIIRNDDKEIDILIAVNESDKKFCDDGGDDIPITDKRRKHFIPPTMDSLDGKWLTNHLWNIHQENLDDDCAVCYCRNYGADYWLPSGGELSVIMTNKDAVNELLTLIGGNVLAGQKYWVSTQYSDDYSWHYDCETKIFGFWLSKTHILTIRPIKDSSTYVEIVVDEDENNEEE